MELKLLRLEAKINQRDSRRRQRSLERRQPGMGANAPIDRLPPIAATTSTPDGSDDEEIDSFEEQENTPRANRQAPGSTSLSGIYRGGGPIAVVTRSGASVASAVTATSFQDQEEFAHAHDDRSDGIDEDDGSASSEYCAQVSPLSLVCTIYDQLNNCHQLLRRVQGILSQPSALLATYHLFC